MGFWTSIIDWFTVIYPIFAAVAALGSVVAIIFLWLNLVQMRKQVREMQEQKRLEHRGLLAIFPDVFGPIAREPRGDTTKVRIEYRFMRTHRIPLLLITDAWRISQGKEIDVDEWYKEISNKLPQYTKGPLIPDHRYHCDIPAEDFTKDWVRYFYEKPYPSKGENFILHCIFCYEDILENRSWVYMKWNYRFYTSIKIDTEKEEKDNKYIECGFSLEEYRRLN